MSALWLAQRDEFGRAACAYCRFLFKKGNLTADHVIPRVLGGGEGANIVLACFECNNRKGGLDLETFTKWLGGRQGRAYLATKRSDPALAPDTTQSPVSTPDWPHGRDDYEGEDR